MIFSPPTLGLDDLQVLDEIAAMRAELADHLQAPRRWTGRLRRTALARAIRGSNSIEGYRVELDDADAALDDVEPLTADQRTFVEVRGYRQALGYVLAMATDRQFRLDTTALRAMHFMMLGHDLSKRPGQYRPGDIYVHDGRTEQVVYQGPSARTVAALMDELVAAVARPRCEDPLVDAAMAHLNLVMVHPFRDGNGRMARALQTLVLARSGVGEPEFASIEEWLGANTEDYYRVLGATGGATWDPSGETRLWVSFNLRAHHIQAQTVRRRWRRAQRTYELLEPELARHRLPDRTLDALYTATLGYRLRRSSYAAQNVLDTRTASRDFKALTDAGLLAPVGATKGRHYVAGPTLTAVHAHVEHGDPLVDPYPHLRAELAEASSV